MRRETARLGAACARLRQLELGIRFEVESARLAIASARERLRLTKKALEQAEESLRVERQKHAVGMRSITDVLDAEGALLGLSAGHARALAEYHTARARLRLALGGGA